MRIARFVSKLILSAGIVAFSAKLLRPNATPSLQARSQAAALAAAVAASKISDCEALARFAEQPSRTPADWNIFIPANKVNWPLGIPIGLVGVAAPVKLEGADTGFLPRFRKGYGPSSPDGTSHDQAHHFAPYFLLGRRIPTFIADAFLQRAERPESWGDLELGQAAIEMGAADSTADIRNKLCLPDWRSDVGIQADPALF